MLIHQKKRINILEDECNMVRNLALNLHKQSHSATSNNQAYDNSMKMNYKEEEIVHQLNEPMNLEQ